MNKKAQAAMEFLMTYGWAILVVLVVIGALAYFGVLDPTATLPEKCFMPLGIHCDEHFVQSGAGGGVSFDIRNGLGDTMEIDEFKVLKDGGATVVCTKTFATPVTVLNGQLTTIKIPSDGTADLFDNTNYAAGTNACTAANMGNAGTKYKYSIEMTYHKEGKLDYKHSVVGELLAKTE